MDESWRMRMGTPSLVTRRRASEDLTSWTSAESARSSVLFSGSEAGAMDVEDFNDVFGGPPRSVLSRKISCDFSSYDYFYREVFRQPDEEAERSSRSGRRLPAFRIPSIHRAEDKALFYDDIFGSSGNCRNKDDDHIREKKPSSKLWRSLSKSKWTSKPKSKSKSNSSSVLSYEEISPLPIQPGIRVEDVGLTSFAAKLRPINVPCRWNSSSAMGGIHNNRTSERFPSPEADIPHSTTVGISADDVSELESPSSANSMFCHDPEASTASFQFNASADEDEVFSPYVIKINPGRREVTNEAADIDEAIAWAKEKFQGCTSSSEELNVRQHENNCQFGAERSMIPLMMQVPENIQECYPMVSIHMLGTEELDERISSWSAGKDDEIRLLLSTLHHVLWASSGWKAIPLSNLIEYSQVKKAYQKARLCIHPDKLQQRNATPQQKYIAEKAFSILQNAWDSFISQEISFN